MSVSLLFQPNSREYFNVSQKYMCDTKKLCACNSVSDGEDHWRLEFHYGSYPPWGKIVETRPEHKDLAEKAMKEGEHVMGPLPMPKFKELHRGITDIAHMQLAIDAEETWLNERNQFDFDYEPFQGDRLMFVIGGQEIAFSFKDGQWQHYPHQAYSQDYRRGIDAPEEDRKARAKAAGYLQTKRGG